MNTLLWHWSQSRPHIWFLRLRRRVPAAVLGKSWSLKQVQGCVLPGWGELVEKCFQACLKTGTWIYQVKEKYGALRFYIGSAPQWVNNLIHWAEVDSQKTCEICGQPGRARGEYWIKTLCDACLFPPGQALRRRALRQRQPAGG